jgi:hypothetical protein
VSDEAQDGHFSMLPQMTASLDLGPIHRTTAIHRPRAFTMTYPPPLVRPPSGSAPAPRRSADGAVRAVPRSPSLTPPPPAPARTRGRAPPSSVRLYTLGFAWGCLMNASSCAGVTRLLASHLDGLELALQGVNVVLRPGHLHPFRDGPLIPTSHVYRLIVCTTTL